MCKGVLFELGSDKIRGRDWVRVWVCVRVRVTLRVMVKGAQDMLSSVWPWTWNLPCLQRVRCDPSFCTPHVGHRATLFDTPFFVCHFELILTEAIHVYEQLMYKMYHNGVWI